MTLNTLSPLETRFLQALCSAGRKGLSRDELLRQVWIAKREPIIVRVVVSNIRLKLGDNFIDTLEGAPTGLSGKPPGRYVLSQIGAERMSGMIT